MMSKLSNYCFFLFSILSLFCSSAHSQVHQLYREQPLFTNGTDGYKCYRIPAIITVPNGDLLAFAEGRVKGCNDFGDVDVIVKRSTDNGLTWSDLMWCPLRMIGRNI